MKKKNEKQLFRIEAEKKRNSLSLFERREKSFLIQEHCIEFLIRHSLKKIFSYSVYRSEVESTLIAHFILGVKWTLALPKVENEDLTFFKMNYLCRDLKKGKFGIFEPTKDLETIEKKECQVILVPGIAFDKKGFRMGYGKGFYDRFLKTLPNSVLRIALGYEIQLYEELPNSIQDEPIDLLITENSFYFF